ncbi:MAG: hypothetical protein Q9184_004917 [Pyrenodesmia sp. 2 TL-2023]
MDVCGMRRYGGYNLYIRFGKSGLGADGNIGASRRTQNSWSLQAIIASFFILRILCLSKPEYFYPRQAPEISVNGYQLGRTGKISAPDVRAGTLMKIAISALPTPSNGTHFSRAESHFILLYYDYDYSKDEGDANGKNKATKVCEEGRKRDDKGTDEQQPKACHVNRFNDQVDWTRQRTGLSFEEMAAFIAYIRENMEIPSPTNSERDHNAEMVHLTHPPSGHDVAMEYHRLKAFYSYSHD